MRYWPLFMFCKGAKLNISESDFSDVLPKYEGARLIARGGQKLVYAYEDPRYGQVALKLGITSEMSYVKREADTLKVLGSVYFPKHYHLSVIDSKRFLTMEQFIEGKSLRSCLSNYVEVDSAYGLLIQVIDGMQALWNRRIAHRDLKPENIHVTDAGRPVILDLGIARHLGLVSLTNSAMQVGFGTAGYCASEQLNYSKREVNHRADFFSIGVIFAEMLCGHNPFDPNIVGGSHPNLNVIAGKWNRQWFQANAAWSMELFESLLSPHPFERPRDAKRLVKALQHALNSRAQ
jgi:eukaryotic-like serine/threonine-protein kinase